MTKIDHRIRHISDIARRYGAQFNPEKRTLSLLPPKNAPDAQKTQFMINDLKRIGAFSDGIICSISIKSAGLEDVSARVVAEAVDNTTQVTSVDLSFNLIGDRGAISLAGASVSSKLSCLKLAYNRIDNSGGSALADAMGLSELRDLDLRFNRLTDEGRAYLERVIRNIPEAKIQL